MKGHIFTVFGDLVQEKFGLEAWDRLLQKANPSSGGAYTSGGNYPDQELFALVGELSKETAIPVQSLVKAFGEFALARLALLFPDFLKEQANAKSFLMGVDRVIHLEVKKLYPDVMLPRIDCEDSGENRLVMKYESPRKLCALLEGLLEGVAKHFGETIEYRQTECMHRNSPFCRFELRFENGKRA